LVDGEIDTEQYNQILKRVGKNSSKEPITPSPPKQKGKIWPIVVIVITISLVIYSYLLIKQQEKLQEEQLINEINEMVTPTNNNFGY
jgi:uncharacterized membrane protein